ncbi:twin-arginine translocase TatA/TatE family subunit [Exilibacterium tricleocarpae]|uniref:Sec-independent protein translocase protein TatA n=1 Tax=Exilibacterium tricleocarpae TaxID=2591008 RepID=A0A545ST49_9GAMM|nr:twin-arginine translocase TatA/TatE family subunit [Exilibacterium tricleocarpae]TQV68142.1 twin-arginine translocase TatA/TatE family subunit [Exilibacterium tricleocarpae]
MGLSLWQLLLVAVLFLLLFGRGKIPALMTDLAAGIKNFKSGIKEDSAAVEDKTPAPPAPAKETADTAQLGKHTE